MTMAYLRLSDCAYFRNERTSQIDYETYITTDNMLPNRGGITLAESLPDSKTVSRYVQNDILLSNIRPYFKKIWFSTREGGCSNDVLVVTAKDNILPKFLYYVLSDNNFFNYDTVTSKGSKMPRGTPDAIMRYLVPLVSKEKQERIVSILSAYDNLIEVNNKRIKVLEQMAENLYKEWFVRFRFPGHEKAEFENGIPKGWKYIRADAAIIFNPTIKSGNQTGFSIIPMEALSTTSMVIDSGRFVKKDSLSGKRSQNGDTLLAKISPCLENGKTGLVMGLPVNEVYGGSTEFIVMRSKTLTSHFVYCIARSQYFRQVAILSMNGADGRQRVDEDKLKATKIIQPEKSILDHFETIVTPIFESVSNLMQKNQNLIHQRDSLLPRLMSGKLLV